MYVCMYMCVCMYVRVCMYVCMYVYVYMYVCRVCILYTHHNYVFIHNMQQFQSFHVVSFIIINKQGPSSCTHTHTHTHAHTRSLTLPYQSRFVLSVYENMQSVCMLTLKTKSPAIESPSGQIKHRWNKLEMRAHKHMHAHAHVHTHTHTHIAITFSTLGTTSIAQDKQSNQCVSTWPNESLIIKLPSLSEASAKRQRMGPHDTEWEGISHVHLLVSMQSKTQTNYTAPTNGRLTHPLMHHVPAAFTHTYLAANSDKRLVLCKVKMHKEYVLCITVLHSQYLQSSATCHALACKYYAYIVSDCY